MNIYIAKAGSKILKFNPNTWFPYSDLQKNRFTRDQQPKPVSSKHFNGIDSN